MIQGCFNAVILNDVRRLAMSFAVSRREMLSIRLA